MIATILSALPWASIFNLGVKGVVYWIQKSEMTKEAKKDCLEFIQFFHFHREIPVQMTEKWERIVREHKEELEGKPQSEV